MKSRLYEIFGGSLTPTEAFSKKCQVLWPDSTSRRLSSAANVGQRTAQKWLAGEVAVPADIEDFVEQQLGLVLDSDRLGHLEISISTIQAKGINNETIAAKLAEEYRRLVGRPLE